MGLRKADYFLALLAVLAISASVQVPRPQIMEMPPDEEVVVDTGGFGNTSNGLTTDEQFASDRGDFEDTETAATGAGPVLNAFGCAVCHNNPVTGGSNPITELRAGRGDPFVPQTETGLIHNLALDPTIQERVAATSTLTGLRTSTTLLGLGLVEAIDSADIEKNAKIPGNDGFVNLAVLLESPDTHRVGRFGWKAQHASLISFTADANRNEIGRTSTLQPRRNFNPGDPRTFGRPADPVDTGGDQGFGKEVEILARFVRATKPPLPDANILITPDAQAGLALFRSIGCAICHREEYVTVAAGTKINGSTFTIPVALGGKTIRPFSDFLLHDVGTGDGITQGGPQSTAQKFRTPPLWGLRVKPRLMHDARSLTRHKAILRHAGEAAKVRDAYKNLSPAQKRQLQIFLRSL